MTPCNPRTCPMRERIKQLEGVLYYGEPIPRPDLEAIAAAFYAGDKGPLEAYIRKGGEAPSCGSRHLG